MIRFKKAGIFVGAAAILCVSLSGCTQRADVADAYQLYDTTAKYSTLNESSSSGDRTLFASGLCVGGTENTQSDQVMQTVPKAQAYLWSIREKLPMLRIFMKKTTRPVQQKF